MLMKEMEAMLVARFEIADEAQKTFRGRLQNMQRLKFPAGVNTGRGKRVDYGWPEIIQIALAFDLIDAGLPQEPATSLISSQLGSVEFGMSAFGASLLKGDNADRWVNERAAPEGAGAYLVCAANSLRELRASPQSYDSYINYIGEDEMVRGENELNQELLRGGRIVLDLGQLILFVLHYISATMEQGLDKALSDFDVGLKTIEREWRTG